MTPLDVERILSDINYKRWEFELITEPEGAGTADTFMFIRLRWLTSEGPQTSRRWYVSPHSTRSEVIQTALLAVLVAEEHEARENFRYKGSKVFGPHLDTDVLVDLAKKKVNLDLREPVGV